MAIFITWRRVKAYVKADSVSLTPGVMIVCYIVNLRLSNTVSDIMSFYYLLLLQRVLHAAARLVNDLKTSDHVTSTLVDLHWLPIKQRVDYITLLPRSQRTHWSCPCLPIRYADRLCAIIFQAADIISGDYVIPRTRLKLGERAFAVSAPLAWNKLPRELKKTKCTTTFKRLLNIFLFESAYFYNRPRNASPVY